MAGQITEQELGSTKINDTFVNVGSNADAASATGSVHGKLKDIKQSLGAKSAQYGLISNPSFLDVPEGTAANSNQFNSYTVLNVTGKGELHHAFLTGHKNGSSNPSYTMYFKIIIDGVDFFISQRYVNAYDSFADPNTIGILQKDDLLAFGDNNSSATLLHVPSAKEIGAYYGVTYNIPTNLKNVSSESPALVFYKPIPFNTSLKIQCYRDPRFSSTYGIAYCHYGYMLS